MRTLRTAAALVAATGTVCASSSAHAASGASVHTRRSGRLREHRAQARVPDVAPRRVRGLVHGAARERRRSGVHRHGRLLARRLEPALRPRVRARLRRRAASRAATRSSWNGHTAVSSPRVRDRAHFEPLSAAARERAVLLPERARRPRIHPLAAAHRARASQRSRGDCIRDSPGERGTETSKATCRAWAKRSTPRAAGGTRATT